MSAAPGEQSDASDASPHGQTIKCVVVGDGAVGKTALLMTYTSGEFPADYVPTICDNFRTSLDVDGKHVQLSLWDTAGQESYERLRPMSYRGADVFVLCFSTVSSVSRLNVSEKWMREVHHHRPDAPILLVGTKTDARDNMDDELAARMDEIGEEIVTMEQGEATRAEAHCQGFLECSAKTEYNVNLVFEEAVRLHWKAMDKIQSGDTARAKKKTCRVL